MPGDAAPSVPGVFAFAGDAIAGTTEAMRTTAQAVVPVSDFRVGAVAVDADGRAVAGANVEHPLDWTRGLCAERVALVAARAAGLGPLTRVYLACATADDGTPCGGCRQLLAEQAPGAEIVMWRGAAPPEITTPRALLPGAFDGSALR
jgi:homotetrameric cytidine deaminase